MMLNPLIDIRFSLPVCYPGLLHLCSLEILVSTFLVMYLAFCQFSSVVQSCPTLCDPVGCSMPGFLVLHYLPEPTQTHVHELVRPSNHLVLCHPLLLLPSTFPSIRVFLMS